MGAARTYSKRVHLDARRERVWLALTRPAQLSRWLGGRVELEVEPGALGTWVESAVVRAIRVAEVEPGSRLAFLWWPVDEDQLPGSVVTIELADTPDGGTTLTVTETALPDVAGGRSRALLEGVVGSGPAVLEGVVGSGPAVLEARVR